MNDLPLEECLPKIDRGKALKNPHNSQKTRLHRYGCKSCALVLDGGVEKPIVAVNIKERVLSEEALRDSEARYRRLFEAARDGILILDAETGSITDVNPSS